jgi:tripartite-type tricarboxylate transporter receptor subunit TctC
MKPATPTCASILSVIFFILAIGLSPRALAAGAEEFYQGKTIRFIVGFSPGGGHDTYTRLIAKYMGKHIPGDPSMIVQNMPGGGSLISANFLYSRAKPGRAIGKFASGLVRQQVLGRSEIEFDSRQFGWVGAPTQDHLVCTVATASGFKSWKDVMTTSPDKPLIVGGIAPGTSLSDDPRLLQAALGFPMKLVEGYKGSADVRRAAEAGEIHGGCWGWQSVKVTWKDALEAGKVKVLVQVMPDKHPELPDVPTAFEFAKSDESKLLLRIAAGGGRLLRSYAMPPSTPKEIVQVVSNSFMATMKDEAFLARANKAKLDINPLSGEEVDELVNDLFKTPPAVVKKLKKLLLP